MTQLKESDRKYLRGLAHHLKPVVLLGAKGLTGPVMAEIERALDDHELTKVKLNAGDREQRDRDIARIREETGAELVQRVGNIALLYRRHPENPKIALPG